MKILSIIVPAYNAEKYLTKCIDSIICSGFLVDNCEIIIVNDGSTDGTSDLAHSYERRYGNIIVIDKANGGHGSGINAGVTVASGKYFKVIDSDDWVVTENFEKFVHRLLSADVDIVAHYQNNVYENTNQTIAKKVEKIEPGQIYAIEEIPEETLLGLSNVCFRTSIYQNNNIKLDEKCFYVDLEYILYPLKFMKNFVVYDDIVYCYRLGNPNQSVNYKSMYKNRYHHLKVINSLLEFYGSLIVEKANGNLIAYTENIIVGLIKAHYYLYFSNSVNSEDVSELKVFDSIIKKYCNLYEKTGKSKSINLVRVFRFHGYKILMKIYRKMIASKNVK